MELTEPRVMRKVAYGLPAMNSVVVVVQLVWFGWNERFIGSWAFLLFMSYYLGWFLNRRSLNQEAAFFSTTVRPDDASDRKYSVDVVAMLSAPFLLALTFLLPWLRS